MASRPLTASGMHLACHQFTEAEVEALKRLLGLLSSHLVHSWSVVAQTDARVDLLLVNLDHPEPEPPRPGVRSVGCAAKPRTRAAGSIHRPFRAAEILAVLSDVQPAATPVPAAPVAAPLHGEPSRYRLRAWPLDFVEWPQRHWRVLASITRAPLGVHEIVQRSDVAAGEVEELLKRLAGQDLLEITMDPDVAPRPFAAARPGWRNLASRVGQLLGLAR